MKLTTLYGLGAISMSDDHHEYRPKNGVLQVPDHLVNRAKALGFTTYPLPSVEEDAPTAPVDPANDELTNAAASSGLLGEISGAVVPPIDPTQSDAELLFQFSIEAIDKGYSDEAAATIAKGRLANLRAGGDGFDVAPSGLV